MAKRGKRTKEQRESDAANGQETVEAPAVANAQTALGLNPTAAPPTPPTGNRAAKEAASSSPAAQVVAEEAKTPEAQASGSAKPATDRLIVGWLREHGPAHHAFREKAEPSYYLKLQTRTGEELLWGKGLERALATSRTRPQIGDEIGVREIEIRPIAIASAEPKVEGGAVTAPTPRTHWVIERTAFFAERAAAAQALRDSHVQPRQAIRDHPDLIGAYFTLDAARKVAEAKIANPESRERFVALVRETLAHAVERGEPIIEPRRRENHSAQRWEGRPRASLHREVERSR
jgi:hypothetical protein